MILQRSWFLLDLLNRVLLCSSLLLVYSSLLYYLFLSKGWLIQKSTAKVSCVMSDYSTLRMLFAKKSTLNYSQEWLQKHTTCRPYNISWNILCTAVQEYLITFVLKFSRHSFSLRNASLFSSIVCCCNNCSWSLCDDSLMLTILSSSSWIHRSRSSSKVSPASFSFNWKKLK